MEAELAVASIETVNGGSIGAESPEVVAQIAFEKYVDVVEYAVKIMEIVAVVSLFNVVSEDCATGRQETYETLVPCTAASVYAGAIEQPLPMVPVLGTKVYAS